MKRFAFLFMILMLALTLGCTKEEEQEIIAVPPSNHVLPTESPAPATPETTAQPTEEIVETDVITLPVTELIVSSAEEMPDLETLRGMTSLQLLDLTPLPYTPYSEIEQIRNVIPECRILWNQQLTDGTFRSDSASLKLPHATEEDVAMLEVFPELRSVDASGSEAYRALYEFRSSHPSIEIIYTLTLGDAVISLNDESLTVPQGTDPASLSETLHAFPNIRTADLRESGWSDGEVEAFILEFPDISVRRLIRIGEDVFDSETELLDLRSLSGWTADQILAVLPLFSGLKTVALPSDLNESELQRFETALPGVNIVGPVFAFGKTFEGGAEEIDLSGIKVDSVEEAEALLDRLPFLKKAVMCECGLSDSQMETICSAHPDVKFVWTIVIGKRKLRTDAIGFSTKNPSKYTNPNSSDAYNQSVKKAVRLYEGDIEALKYCTDLEALDLGHNYLTDSDLSVIAKLTKLKILILADNKITDISALTTLKDLEYIELFMNKIPDLSPLTEMPSLVDVNVCNVGASDLTPLFSLTGVKRLWYAMNPFSREQAKALKEALPDCVCNYTTRNETAEGWRDDPRYHWMRSYFE